MKNRNEKVKELLKRAATISLCAVLAGGMATGIYEGTGYFTNQTNVQAASSDTLTLTKSSKEKDSKDFDEKEEKEKSTTKGSLDVSDIAEKVMPSVVAITTVSVEEVQNYFGMFGQYGYAPETEQEVQGSGSGIIVGKNDSELLIATNYHVVEDAKTVSVGFVDNNAYEAKVKGYDSDKDLAVVAVSLDDISDDTLDAISIATIGDSDELKVGEQVVAIGNALGYGQSVTTGIVSAKNRKADSNYNPTTEDEENSKKNSDDGINLIQTDAAINPGNSGGALLNMDGEVVGINSAKLADTTVEGMGYAIAISDVDDILEDLMNQETREKVEDGNHGLLGIKGATVSEEGQMYGIPAGVFVAEVTEGGGAEAAGIEENSVITKVDGRRVKSIDELLDLLEYYEPDEEVEVTLQVPSGKEYEEKTVTVKLTEDTSKKDEESDDSDDKKEDGEERSSLYRDWESSERAGDELHK